MRIYDHCGTSDEGFERNEDMIIRPALYVLASAVPCSRPPDPHSHHHDDERTVAFDGTYYSKLLMAVTPDMKCVLRTQGHGDV